MDDKLYGHTVMDSNASPNSLHICDLNHYPSISHRLYSLQIDLTAGTACSQHHGDPPVSNLLSRCDTDPRGWNPLLCSCEGICHTRLMKARAELNLRVEDQCQKAVCRKRVTVCRNQGYWWSGRRVS